LPIWNLGIRAGVQQVLMRVPEVPVRFVHLRIFLLLPDRGETFLLLVSHPSGLNSLTTNEERDRSEQANKLKLFHI